MQFCQQNKSYISIKILLWYVAIFCIVPSLSVFYKYIVEQLGYPAFQMVGLYTSDIPPSLASE